DHHPVPRRHHLDQIVPEMEALGPGKVAQGGLFPVLEGHEDDEQERDDENHESDGDGGDAADERGARLHSWPCLRLRNMVRGTTSTAMRMKSTTLPAVDRP